jgi:hypothetical protein
MAFTGNWTTNTFLVGLLDGVYKFDGTQTYNIALYTNSATLNQDTTTYTGTTGEVVASGYTAGGQALSISQVPTIGNSGSTAYLSFTNAVWTTSVTARGALIYLANGTTNPTVCVLDFGSDKTSSTTFTVQFPAVTNTSAIIRLS